MVAASFIFTSCETGDSLLDKEPEGNVSDEQIADVIKQYPEKALTILAGAESGNNSYMYSFATNGENNHADFGYKGILTGLDHMTNDLIMVQDDWFGDYYNYRGREVTGFRVSRLIWNFEYKVIYNMNSVLVSLIGDSSEDEVNHLKGRALAIRANAYMDLIRSYAVGEQGIPYYSQGDEDIEETARMATSEVWNHILSDLEEAYSLLQGYDRGAGNKEMVNEQIVAGFLARAYLYTGQYSQAAHYANIARAGYSPMSESGLFDGFQFIDNPNWMWGVDITSATSTVYASFFSHMDNFNEGYAGLLGTYRVADKRLYEEIPDSDIRKEWFLSPEDAAEEGLPDFAHVKFHDDTFFEGDYLYMRADEFWLIEAEGLARSGDEGGARSVLEELVQTRNPDFSAAQLSGDDLINEIHFQRRVELWGEGGQWWEMKRNATDLVRDYDDTNHPRFGRFNYTAGSDKFTIQIPQDELNGNPDVSN